MRRFRTLQASRPKQNDLARETFETFKEMNSRHLREYGELKQRIKQKKYLATDETRQDIDWQCDDLERRLKRRQYMHMETPLLVDQDTRKRRASYQMKATELRDHTAAIFNIDLRLQWMETEKVLLQTLEAKERELGPDNISTIDSVKNNARVYFDQGKLVEAEDMYLDRETVAEVIERDVDMDEDFDSVFESSEDTPDDLQHLENFIRDLRAFESFREKLRVFTHPQKIQPPSRRNSSSVKQNIQRTTLPGTYENACKEVIMLSRGAEDTTEALIELTKVPQPPPIMTFEIIRRIPPVADEKKRIERSETLKRRGRGLWPFSGGEKYLCNGIFYSIVKDLIRLTRREQPEEKRVDKSSQHKMS
ncbi:hypothetical protein EYC80_009756 [Monilinia laxa]|uniref:Uncharacterized protein n=1 Tax=Monilinia laxa TaxID=61186 RepID=A0A5N6JTH3_MONLA|nr:hypothetical protein EYC80_009756 [Monilinia laxa]